MQIAMPTQSTERKRYGVAEALVVDVNDPEKEGRVRVRFPWFDRDMISDWCRVAQLYAGNGYGSLFVPEERDEVLVAFVHGDMRQPVILGGLYNGQDKPAAHRARDRDEKLIRTKAGNQILFVDTTGEERIEITDSSTKHQIVIDTSNEVITITSAGGRLRLSAREIEITADERLTLKASTVEATASADMTLKGSTINLN
jgi:uncharacterized protein involved in type VI secretion and phage assembly